jgi:DNA polymerase III subunit delta'
MTSFGANWGLIGHEWAVEFLGARLQHNRVSHAYLITGMESAGKALLARRLAQAMNCTGKTPPCGVCRSCEQIERGQHPDVITIAPEGSSIKIETVREAQNFLTLRPVEARWRAAVIIDAHKLTPAAADALLKTLEEPPATARLILTAGVAEAVLPTIVSRCQGVSLRPVPAAAIQSALEAGYGAAADTAALIARLSGGRPGWAVRAAATNGGGANVQVLLSSRAEMITAMLSVLQAQRLKRFEYAEMVSARSDTLVQVLDLWQSWWRDVVLVAQGGDASRYAVHTDQWDALLEIAQQTGRTGASRALQTVYRTAEQLERTSVNPRLALEVMMLKIPYLAN